MKKLLRVFHLCRVYSLFLAKTMMLSLSFSLFFPSGSLQSSYNTPHITLSEFGLEVVLRSQRLDLKNYFSLFTLRQATYN